jgi:D-alanyl-D-alanine carboxypeptidase (penicillin-binding protein 5/6)
MTEKEFLQSICSFVSNYARLLQRKPSSWFLAIVLALIPLPSLPTPKELAQPFLRLAPVELSSISPYPVNIGKQAPALTARGIYIVDLDSMVPLLVKNPDLRLRPASTTKIMTALVALDAFGESEVLTAKNANNAIGKAIHLKSGERVTFENMLYGLLLESGNDAAYALAENYPGGYSAMVETMNEKAKKLGMRDTNFRNVSGVDEFRHETTVHDLAILTSSAMKNTQFSEVVGTKEKEIESLDGTVVHKLVNTNQLLGEVPGVLGVKTGLTELAGESLVTYVERDGHRIVLVMLGSQDRFGETKKLINWVFENHEWRVLINTNKYK